jgi:hypothetical protein
MSNDSKKPSVIDPQQVPEILCDGRFVIHRHGNLATLTFTAERPKLADLFSGKINNEEVVRARITISLNSVAALRDSLARLIQSPDTPATPAGGITHH